MRMLKPIILALFGLLASVGLAQIPAPQIPLGGNIGCAGFPCLNNGTLQFTSDANHTMTAQETSALAINVTSSVSLTATRNLIYPAGRFGADICNNTSGSQSIQVIGPSGGGVTIANGSCTRVWNNGAGFLQIGASGAGSGCVPGGATNSLQKNNGSGGCAGSSAIDNGTTFAVSEPVTVPSILAGTSLLNSTGINTSGNDFTFTISTANLFLAPTSSGTNVQIQAGNTFTLGALSGCLSADATSHAVSGSGSACGSGGGGSNVTVNGGSTLATANFNGTTPAAGSGFQNSTFQVSGNNISVENPLASSSVFGLAKCDGTTITCTSGVIAAVASGIPTSPTNALVKINGLNGAASLATDDGTTLTYPGTGGTTQTQGRHRVGTALGFTPQTIAGGGFQNDEYQETAIDSFAGLVWHHHQNLDSSLNSAVINALANDLNTTDFTYCGGQDWYLSSAGYSVAVSPNWDDRGNAFDRFNNCGNINHETGLGDYQAFITDLNYQGGGILNASNLPEIIQPNGVTAFYKLAGFNTNILANPAAPSGSPSTTGGTVAAGSNYAKLVGLDFATFPYATPSQNTAGGTESSVVTTTGSTSSIAWTWTPNPLVLSYQLWLGTTSNGEANYFAVNPAAYESGYGTAAVISGATVPAGTYFFRVVAVDALGNKTLLGNSDTLGSVTVSSPQNSIIWSCPATAQAASYQIWVGSSPGAETNFFTFTPPANNPNYCEYMQTLPTSSGTSGTTPTYTFLQVAPISSGTGGSLPTSNTTGLINGVALSSSGAATSFLNQAGAYTPPFTLTTTGSSGPATFSGGVLNIPSYAGGGPGTGTPFSVAYWATGSTLGSLSSPPTGTLWWSGTSSAPRASTTSDTAALSISGNAATTSALSGMTATQVPIAATATTVTSSMPIAGTGAGLTSGPTTSTNGTLATYTGTGGQLANGTITLANVVITSSVSARSLASTLTQQLMPEYTVATVASATTIAPTTPLAIISGTTPVSTITAPTGTAALIGATFDFITSSAVPFTTGGNIASAFTTTANTLYRCVFMGTTNGLWYCK